MSFQSTLALLLVVHVIGLSMMAGSVLASFALSTQINKYVLSDNARALTLIQGTARLLPFIGLGALLLILSGTCMVLQLKGGVTQMLWFRVKMPLVLLLIVNPLVFGRPASMKMGKLLAQGMTRDVQPLTGRLRVVYWVQIVLLLAIFTLSIFKFS